MLELSLWVSENNGWPVVGWWMTGFVAAVAVAWIVVEARFERDRKRRIADRKANLRDTSR